MFGTIYARVYGKFASSSFDSKRERKECPMIQRANELMRKTLCNARQHNH